MHLKTQFQSQKKLFSLLFKLDWFCMGCQITMKLHCTQLKTAKGREKGCGVPMSTAADNEKR